MVGIMVVDSNCWEFAYLYKLLAKEYTRPTLRIGVLWVLNSNDANTILNHIFSFYFLTNGYNCILSIYIKGHRQQLMVHWLERTFYICFNNKFTTFLFFYYHIRLGERNNLPSCSNLFHSPTLQMIVSTVFVCRCARGDTNIALLEKCYSWFCNTYKQTCLDGNASISKAEVREKVGRLLKLPNLRALDSLSSLWNGQHLCIKL